MRRQFAGREVALCAPGLLAYATKRFSVLLARATEFETKNLFEILLAFLINPVFLFFAIFVNLLSLVVVICLMSPICAVECWSEIASSENNIHFLSAHIMQCKYVGGGYGWILPWLLFFCFSGLFIIWHHTWWKLYSIAQVQHGKTVAYMPVCLVVDAGVVIGVLGGYLVVQYDHKWLSGESSCSGGPAGAAYDPSVLHGIGVIMLLVGVALVHIVTSYEYMCGVLSNGKFSFCRRCLYLDFEVLYFVCAVLFLVLFLTDNVVASVVLEYATLFVVLGMSFFNCYVFFRTHNRLKQWVVPLPAADAVFGKNGVS